MAPTFSAYSGNLSSTMTQQRPSRVPTNIAFTGRGGNGLGVTCEVEEEGEASGPCVDHGAGEGQHSHPGHLPGQEDDGHEEPEAMPARHDDLEETAEEDGTEGQVRVSHCHLWCYLLSKQMCNSHTSFDNSTRYCLRPFNLFCIAYLNL